MFLRYDVGVVGVDRIRRTLGSLERMYATHNQRVARSAATPQRTAARRAGREVAASKAAQAAEAKRIQKTAAAEEAAAQKRRARKLRDIEAVARAEERAAQRRERREDRLHARETKKRIRQAEQVARAEARARRQAVMTTARSRERFARAVPGFIGGSVGRTVRGVGRLAMGALAIGGGFAAAQAIERENDFDYQLRLLANQAWREGGPSREKLYEQFRSTAVQAGAGGIGRQGVAGGMRRFVALTGEGQIAAGLAPRMAKIATATGANIEDVASTAGESMLLLQQRGIKGADALKELDDILLTLAAQGKRGSIEFAEFAQVMSKVGASTSKFTSMSVTEIVALNAALAQLGKKGGASTAEEAGTALMRMQDILVEKGATAWKKAGIDVYTYGKGPGGKEVATGLRNPLELFMEAYAKTGGDIRKMQKLTNIRSKKVIEPIIDLMRNVGGGDLAKGAKEVHETIAHLTQKMTEPELAEDVRSVEQSARFKMAAARERFEEAVGPKLAQTIVNLIPHFERLIPLVEKGVVAFADLVDWVSKNPFKSVGILIGGALVKDIAAAGIGAAAKATLVSILKSATIIPTVPGVPGAAGVPGGAAGAGAAGAGAGAAGFGVGAAYAGVITGTSHILSGVAHGREIAKATGGSELTGGIIGGLAGTVALGPTGILGGITKPLGEIIAGQITGSEKPWYELATGGKGMRRGIESGGFKQPVRERTGRAEAAAGWANAQQMTAEAGKSLQAAGSVLNESANALSEAARRLGKGGNDPQSR